MAQKIIGLILVAFAMTACDRLTWYKNPSLQYQKKTHAHFIQQPEMNFQLRVFQFLKQTVVEIQPTTSLNKNTLSLTDIALSASGKIIPLKGFLENFKESEIRKYKPEQLNKDSGSLEVGKNLAIVFDSVDADAIDLKIFATSNRFEKDEK